MIAVVLAARLVVRLVNASAPQLVVRLMGTASTTESRMTAVGLVVRLARAKVEAVQGQFATGAHERY